MYTYMYICICIYIYIFSPVTARLLVRLAHLHHDRPGGEGASSEQGARHTTYNIFLYVIICFYTFLSLSLHIYIYIYTYMHTISIRCY